MTYRELQNALKELRNQGASLQVKLNAKREVLMQEYVRLTAPTPTITDEIVSTCGKLADLGMATEYVVSDEEQTLEQFLVSEMGQERSLVALHKCLALVIHGKAYPLNGHSLDLKGFIQDRYKVL